MIRLSGWLGHKALGEMQVLMSRFEGLLRSPTSHPGGTERIQTHFHHLIERQNIEASRLRGREGMSATREAWADEREELGEHD